MNYILVISEDAEADLAEAQAWYDRQRSGLSADFLANVDQVFDRIRKTPQMHAEVYQDVRRAVVRRFPYVIYYRIEIDVVAVLAVIRGGRDPKVWQSRV